MPWKINGAAGRSKMIVVSQERNCNCARVKKENNSRASPHVQSGFVCVVFARTSVNYSISFSYFREIREQATTNNNKTQFECAT